MTTSVVITTYNRRASLEGLIEPLLRDPATTEVVVVVDHCHDGSIEHLRALSATDRRIVPVWADRNLGQPEARRLGVRTATSELIVSLDDDVRPADGLISGHAARHSRTGNAVVLGSMPVRLPERRGAHDFPAFHYSDSYERQCRLYEADPAHVLEEFWAGNFSVRRADFLRAVEGWDLGTPYHEDRLLGRLLRNAGLRGVYDESLRAQHLYDRPWAGFVRDGISIGQAYVLLRERYPDAVHSFGFEGDLTRSRSRAVRALLRFSTRARARPIVYRSLALAIRATGRLRLWDVQDKLAGLVRRVGHLHGVRLAFDA